MDEIYYSDVKMRGQRRRQARAASAAAEADLAMRLLIAALVLVLGAVVAASTLIQLGEFRRSAAADPAAGTLYAGAIDAGGRTTPCVRLADADHCATPAEVAARLVPSRLAR